VRGTYRRRLGWMRSLPGSSFDGGHLLDLQLLGQASPSVRTLQGRRATHIYISNTSESRSWWGSHAHHLRIELLQLEIVAEAEVGHGAVLVLARRLILASKQSRLN
jgi:hypothetical protein